jgi:hypothetical protein
MRDVRGGEGQGGDGKSKEHYFILKRFKVISFVMNVNFV